ncbi:hypothetical protein C7330_4628 [Pectobacterium versatile]|nr:hypothetical protein C7330_4628 [Pectobacterium versatile]
MPSIKGVNGADIRFFSHLLLKTQKNDLSQMVAFVVDGKLLWNQIIVRLTKSRATLSVIPS